MSLLSSDGLRFENNRLLLLDQTLLPNQEKWIACDTPQDMFDAILQLKVRGAPLIGVAASLFIGQFVLQKPTPELLNELIDYLISCRPTAVNLQILLEQHRQLIEGEVDENAHLELAIQHYNEDVKLCDDIGRHGASLIKDNDTILTHCNAGSLATAGIGTAVGVIKAAAKIRTGISAFVDETRPLLQGARLTAWELQRSRVPYKLICDNMAAFLMQQRKIDIIVVGADRICANGDFANKIGTYSLAVLAKHHDIPFYVAAPYTTIDFDCAEGRDIPIEQRKAEEVKGFHNAVTQLCWSPIEAEVYNPSFDVTPAELVTGFILNHGIFSAEKIQNCLR